MALILADRVQQTGTANTTVSFTLSGSVTGFQSFAVVGNGNTTYYSAFDASGNWEVGLGTYSTTGPTLTRTTILSSSNGGLAVTFSGTVNVFVTYPSEKSVNQDANGNVGIGMTPVANYGALQVGSAVTSALGVSGLQAYVSSTNSALGQNGNVSVITTNAQAADIGGSIGLGGKFVSTGLSVLFAQISGRKENSTDNNSAGYLQFATQPNGGTPTERMRIDSSGNVGIGTSSPSYKLDVQTSGATVFNFQTSATNGGYGIWNAGTVPAYIGSQKAILATGNASDFAIVNTGANNLVFGTNSTERMRIDSSGNLLVGATSSISFSSSSQTGFNASPTGQIIASLNNDSNYMRRIGTDGNLITIYKGTSAVGAISVTTTNTTYGTSSDYRLKEKIAVMTGALDKVAKLKPVTYTWKINGSDGEGFIAHELAEVCPQAVSGEKDAIDENGNPVYQGIDTSFLVATLTAAIQELNAKVDAQALEIATLKAK